MKKIGYFFSLILGVTLSAVAASAFASSKNTTKVDAAVGNYTTNPATYYNSVTATSGNSLLGQLHDLLVTTHKTYTTYDDNGKNLYQQKFLLYLHPKFS